MGQLALPALANITLSTFRENPGFLAKTERRVVSYWYACQHVGYRERGAVPGSRVAAAFKRMADADVNIGEFTSS